MAAARVLSPSTRSTRRGSVVTSSHSRAMHGSSSDSSRSRRWTTSRGSHRRSRSIRRRHRAIRAPPWERLPRSRTTCVYSTPGSECNIARAANAKSGGKHRSRWRDACRSYPPVRTCCCSRPWCVPARGNIATCSRSCASTASTASVWTDLCSSSTSNPTCA